MRPHSLLLLAAPALLAATPASAKDPLPGGIKYKASLTGSAVRTGGDADGRGTAELTLNVGQRQLCYHVMVKDIAAPTAAHIHLGAAGRDGPPRVTLAPFSGEMSHGCATLDRATARAILADPTAFYVNVHTAANPGGAIRGQLSK